MLSISSNECVNDELNCSNELVVAEQHIQNKKLNQVLMDFDPGRRVDE